MPSKNRLKLLKDKARKSKQRLEKQNSEDTQCLSSQSLIEPTTSCSEILTHFEINNMDCDISSLLGTAEIDVSVIDKWCSLLGLTPPSILYAASVGNDSLENFQVSRDTTAV